MQPKFAVGEVVILQSVERPEFNGEHTVLAVIGDGEMYRGARCGNGDDMPGYDLGIALSYWVHDTLLFQESALRKRHTPGDYSFEDLKTVLHLPVTREEMRRIVREKCNG